MTTADEWKAKGNEAFSAHKFDDAIEYFSNAIELAPENHVLYSNRSAAYASLNQFNQALADADKVVQLKPDWPKGYSRKGVALIGLDRKHDALACYEQGLKYDPQNEQFKSEIEQIKEEFEQEGNGMAQIFGSMLKGFQHPKFFELLALSPETSAFANDPEFLAKIKAIQKNPNLLSQYLTDQRVMAALTLAMKLTQPTPQQQQQQQQQQQEEEDDESEAAHGHSHAHGHGHGHSHDHAHPTAAETKKPEAAKKQANDHLTPEEREKLAQKEQANAHKERGNSLYKEKKFEDALAAYDQAIALDATEMTFYLNKSAVYFEMKNFDSSIELALKAIEVGRSVRADYKQIAKAYIRVGNAYNAQNKFDEAIQAYQSSLTESYSDDASKKLKDCKKRKEETEKLAYLDEGKSNEARERGNELFKQADFKGAITEYQESIKRNPNNAAVYSNLSACYGKLGQFPLAIEMADKCLSLDPKFVRAYVRKAGFQFYLKEYHKAIENYQKALELDPENAEAKDGIYRTRVAIQSSSGDKERAAHAFADKEIQAILSDPIIQNILNDLSTGSPEAQKHLRNPEIAAKIQKLIDAGVLSTK